MPTGYHHLTYDQRCQICTLKTRGDSLSKIASEVGVDRSTISREIGRNARRRGYRFKRAHERSKQRRHLASVQPRKMTPDTVATVEERLKMQWSPEQIAGRLKKEGHRFAMSHETSYRHIWRDKRKGGGLYRHLRHRGKKYNKRGAGKGGRGCIPNRVDIEERPSIVGQKCRRGDLEVDTIIGKGQRGAVLSIVDRASKLTHLVKLRHRRADEVEQAMKKTLRPIKHLIWTITSDNGKEFANHQGIALGLKIAFYFAKPYRSWERGLNEHTNGLVRQYLPKSTSFDDVGQTRLHEIEILLNNRPRKVLEFQTPIETFQELGRQSKLVALQS